MAGSPRKRERRAAALEAAGVVPGGSGDHVAQIGARLPAWPTPALGVPTSPRQSAARVPAMPSPAKAPPSPPTAPPSPLPATPSGTRAPACRAARVWLDLVGAGRKRSDGRGDQHMEKLRSAARPRERRGSRAANGYAARAAMGLRDPAARRAALGLLRDPAKDRARAHVRLDRPGRCDRRDAERCTQSRARVAGIRGTQSTAARNRGILPQRSRAIASAAAGISRSKTSAAGT